MNLDAHIQNIEAALQQALTLCQMGSFVEAQALYSGILQTHPNQPKALTNLAAIEFQSGHSEAGLELIRKSIEADANQPYAFYNASNELLKLKRYEQALEYCNRAVALKHDFAQAYNNQGIALEGLERQNEALASYDKAIALRPDYVEAYNNRGVILHQLMRFEDALVCYDRAIALKPEYAKAHNNRGNLLKDINRLHDALECYGLAIRALPDFAEAYFNRGVMLANLDRLNEAIADYDQAIILRPDYADAYCNRGYIMQQLNRFEDALRSYNRAIELDHELPWANWNKSILLLLLGEYSEGWKLYEWRWKTCQIATRRNFAQPLWLGDSAIAEKTLLIYAEQGFGDFIQFCRYAPMAEALGAKVILEVPTAMLSLMQSLEGNFTIVEKYQPLPFFDLQCPVMSLPRAFNTMLQTIPAVIPYLSVDESKKVKWVKLLGDKKRLRVGLAWSGSATIKKRSISLQQLAPILQLPLEFHSLQKEIKEEDVMDLEDFTNLHAHQNELQDFSDTAALISELDLVISIDTSVAHLAGALGKDVWILVPFSPDFRWLTARKDSPWYPGALLFRQSAMDDWDGVISDVAAKLEQFR